jgi:hypothetical protein
LITFFDIDFLGDDVKKEDDEEEVNELFDTDEFNKDGGEYSFFLL